jgi:deoxycytidylate deaminase
MNSLTKCSRTMTAAVLEGDCRAVASGIEGAAPSITACQERRCISSIYEGLYAFRSFGYDFGMSDGDPVAHTTVAETATLQTRPSKTTHSTSHVVTATAISRSDTIPLWLYWRERLLLNRKKS